MKHTLGEYRTRKVAELDGQLSNMGKETSGWLQKSFGRANGPADMLDTQTSEATNDQSFMKTVLPNQSFRVNPVSEAQVRRDETQAVSKADVKQLQDKTSQNLKEVQNTKADFQQAWDAAKAEALQAVIDVAGPEKASAAVAAVLPPQEAQRMHMSLMEGAAVGLAGGGSMATALAPASMATAYLDHARGKGLSKEEVEAIVEEAHARLSAQSSPEAQAQFKTAGPQSGESPLNQKYNFQWHEMQPDEFMEFLQADIEDQPEMQQIMQVEHVLEEGLEHQEELLDKFDNNQIEMTVENMVANKNQAGMQESLNIMAKTGASSVDEAKQMEPVLEQREQERHFNEVAEVNEKSLQDKHLAYKPPETAVKPEPLPDEKLVAQTEPDLPGARAEEQTMTFSQHDLRYDQAEPPQPGNNQANLRYDATAAVLIPKIMEDFNGPLRGLNNPAFTAQVENYSDMFNGPAQQVPSADLASDYDNNRLFRLNA